MKLFDIMKNFNEEIPPQNVDLLVCDNPADPEDRIFERVCFFRKGTLLPHEYRAKGKNDVEQFFDHLENEQSAWKPAFGTAHCEFDPKAEGVSPERKTMIRYPL